MARFLRVSVTPLIVLLVTSILLTEMSQPAADDGYIHYGSIKGDTVPCNKQIPGEEQNCRPHPAPTPYNRGCSKIDLCRGGHGK
ncbi:hypothetical protein KSP39_PZI006280 [Platanthera zijinensis]|uniref:Uncharacterized protein n=1 Tax=Platanthera zijinensis TaxID=2320716 RepID=A0AAP0BTH7_9ASPA